MNSFSKSLLTIIFVIGFTAVLRVNGAPQEKPDQTNAILRSVFIMPSSSKEGRDPFFPDSMRPYQLAAAASARMSDFSTLMVRGFSGDMPNRLVIINNHTFAAGDEGDVTTPAGHIHLRCIEIKTNSAVVEVGGQVRELFYSNKP